MSTVLSLFFRSEHIKAASSPRLASTRFDSLRLASTRFDSLRLASTRFDSLRLASTRFDSPSIEATPGDQRSWHSRAVDCLEAISDRLSEVEAAGRALEGSRDRGIEGSRDRGIEGSRDERGLTVHGCAKSGDRKPRNETMVATGTVCWYLHSYMGPFQGLF